MACGARVGRVARSSSMQPNCNPTGLHSASRAIMRRHGPRRNGLVNGTSWYEPVRDGHVATGFRFLCPKGCGGSSPPSRTTAIDGDRECRADLVHLVVAESAQTFDEDGDGDALDGVEVHRARSRDRIGVRFEHHFTWQPADRCRARGDQRPLETRDGRVTAQDHDRPPADLRQFAPPELTSTRCAVHDEAAAVRNEARSPHSSGSSIGCSS